MPATPDETHEPNSPDVTGWSLEDARAALITHNVAVIETSPPRACGPLGDWRVLRCRYDSESEQGQAQCELLIAREQLPKVERSDS